MCTNVKLATNGSYLRGGTHDQLLNGDSSETTEKCPFYYFSRGTVDLRANLHLLLTSHRLTVGAFTATASQYADQILGGFSHVFRH